MDKATIFLSNWLETHLAESNGRVLNWHKDVYVFLSPEQQKKADECGATNLEMLDFSSLLSVFIGNFHSLKLKYHLSSELKSFAMTAKALRNSDAHRTAKDIKNLTPDKLQFRLLAIKNMLKDLGATDDVLSDIQSSRMQSTRLRDDISRNHVHNNASSVVKPIAISTLRKEATFKTRDIGKKDWGEIAKLRFENIKSSLKLEFPQLEYGACDFLKRGDKIPDNIALRGEWQYAIWLNIKSGDLAKVAEDLTKFNEIEAQPFETGGYIVWQYPPESAKDNNCRVGAKIATTAFLPKWVTNKIYGDLGLQYKTDCVSVQHNLNADDEFSKQYLATYFPRTFAEVCNIFDYVFEIEPSLVQGLRETVLVLDVGCGSGAASLSLIWSLKKAKAGQVKKIIVFGLDGNENFLKRFEEMIPAVQQSCPLVEIEIRPIKVNINDISLALNKMPKEAHFDFILSSKFVQELSYPNSFGDLISLCLARLKPRGVLCMIENYRNGRTEENCHIAMEKGRKNYLVQLESKLEFCIGQVPGCEFVNEAIGFQILISNRREAS
ncbi:MAG: class I SAM-dependent methyltransferase [Kiritimatiellae bacterium]|nr:class I SAM-dependent methyltransferase [Kiritimatiellia bacterium]